MLIYSPLLMFVIMFNTHGRLQVKVGVDGDLGNVPGLKLWQAETNDGRSCFGESHDTDK